MHPNISELTDYIQYGVNSLLLGDLQLIVILCFMVNNEVLFKEIKFLNYILVFILHHTKKDVLHSLMCDINLHHI